VNDLAAILRARDIGGFDDVKTLVNETDANIRLSLEDFFADKKPDDLLVVYFSGHGVRDEQGLLYLASTTRAPTGCAPRPYPQNSSLAKWIAAVPSGKYSFSIAVTAARLRKAPRR